MSFYDKCNNGNQERKELLLENAAECELQEILLKEWGCSEEEKILFGNMVEYDIINFKALRNYLQKHSTLEKVEEVIL